MRVAASVHPPKGCSYSPLKKCRIFGKKKNAASASANTERIWYIQMREARRNIQQEFSPREVLLITASIPTKAERKKNPSAAEKNPKH